MELKLVMRKASIFISSSLMLVLISCGSEKIIISHWYGFSDSPSRSIQLAFSSDSTFKLINAVSGNLAFSVSGQWRKIDHRTFILINPNAKVHGAAGPQAYKTEENIDEILASTDHRYIFPSIGIDTIVFSEHYKRFDLKGYPFVIGRRIKSN
ncbi:hypothetical protein BDE36_2610 [Arcticibacter tournemirensis]|uniref:Uncharacterized protein n=1 Tax=Arcticibacter tournemirensis TaxID=699437 RepID=A0A5M9GP51_9SPHI|nr:hypothetical protein [Arcticibacter tournemirensis]KAA8476150.1 hypothetical protein F1649_20390 [Arcticibacter tournemirensis]TQM50846.1 hypothetical protein BDE36_2610 [Arcticibacter tournemirensis]